MAVAAVVQPLLGAAWLLTNVLPGLLAAMGAPGSLGLERRGADHAAGGRLACRQYCGAAP